MFLLNYNTKLMLLYEFSIVFNEKKQCFITYKCECSEFFMYKNKLYYAKFVNINRL